MIPGDPNAFAYRDRFKNNLKVLEAMKESEGADGTKAERANVGQGAPSKYRGPYDYPAGDDETLRLLAGYKSLKGNASTIWKSLRKQNGKLGVRGKYFKWSNKKQEWKRLSRDERQKYMARARRGQIPVPLPKGILMKSYLKNVRRNAEVNKASLAAGKVGAEKAAEKAYGSTPNKVF